MSAATYNITMERGIYFEEQFTFKDAGGIVINLTGYTFNSSIKKKGSSKLEKAFTTALVNATQGKMKISMAGADTQFLTPGTLEYDIVAKDSGNKVRRYVKGEVIVNDIISPTTFA